MTSSDHLGSPRIALLTGGLKLGGTTTFLVNLAGELVRRNIPVEVFSFERDNPLATDFRSQNVPVLCLDEHGMIFEDRLKFTLQNLARFCPTVAVASLGPASFEVLRYVPPGVLRVGAGQSDDEKVYATLKIYAPHLDVLAVVSRAMKERALALPELALLPVHYLPYGVPMPDDSQIAQPNPDRPLRLLYLGRLQQEQKRVQLFPQILRQLSQSGIPFQWTIAGDGPELEFLRQNLKTNRPDQQIAFLGSVSYAKVPSLLREHDVFLLASNYEGLPLSLLEAMSHGLVPVVSDLRSGIGEVVDATTGIRVNPTNVEGYAAAIIHLNEHRGELAAKSAVAHKRVRREFSVVAMTDRWLAALSSAEPSIAPWPKRWRIRAPLTASNAIHFSLPMRVLRRIAARLRR